MLIHQAFVSNVHILSSFTFATEHKFKQISQGQSPQVLADILELVLVYLQILAYWV
jgi:hypothetical protein